jgi:hypothetical protein
MGSKIKYVLVILALITACGYKSENDVFKDFSLGLGYQCKDFINSSQIVSNDEKSLIFVLHDIKSASEGYAPHLLVFDTKMVMLGACYFQSEKIDSVRSGIVYGSLNKSRARVKRAFRCELPPQVDIVYTEKEFSSSKKTANKLLYNVSQIGVDSLLLNVRVAKDKYLGFRPGFLLDKSLSSYVDTLEKRVSIFDFTFNVAEKTLKHSQKKSSSYQYDHIFWTDKLTFQDFESNNCTLLDLLRQ